MQNVKGTTDYYGKEQAMRGRIRGLMRDVFERYDYMEMDTAVLNEMPLLTAKYSGGEEIVQEMYRLRDRGERELGLRYDLTVPFAKVIAMQPGLAMPIRRYEFGKVFRDGPVKRGRMREFMQCDVDVAGIQGPEAEAELMQLAADVFAQLGLSVVIRWNNRRFLSEWLQAAGVPEQASAGAMLTIDKLAKAGIDAVRAELHSRGIPQDAAEAVISDLTDTAAATPADSSSAFASFEQLCSKYGISQYPGAQEVRTLHSLLTSIGLSRSCTFDASLTRGLSFYTGTVYEAFDASGSYTSSLCGGGRYDAIIGQLTGNPDADYVAAGLSFGLEPILELLRERFDRHAPAPVTVIPIGSQTEAAMRAAAALRSSGIRTRLAPAGRKLRKALASASADGTPFVVLVGEDEAADDTVRLKEMSTMNEAVLDIEETIYRIERLLKLPYR